MPRNGSGSYSRAVAPYVFDTVIDESAVNSEMDDIASALTGSLAANGETTPTANITMGGFKLTSVGAATTRSDAPNAGQVQDGKFNWVDGGGAADAITASYSPAVTALVDGQLFYVRATAANATTTPTFSPNGLTAHTIVKNGGNALAAGDIRGDGHELILRYDLTNTRYELLNAGGASPTTTRGDLITRGASADQRLAIGAAYSRLSTDGTDPLWLTIAKAVGFTMLNGTLTATVGSNNLTIAIKGQDGNDPSSTNPVHILFRNATAATGDYTVITLTAATSLVVTNGSLLGTSNSIAFRLWVVGFNDAGTFRLGVINCLSGLNIYPLGQNPLASSTAEGGSGGADSAQVFYTGTAVTSKPYTILGTLVWETGLGTAGAWSAGPTRIRLFDHHHPLPGDVVQTVASVDGAVATGTTTLPIDDTIPQNTEGDQYASQAVTPTSAANLLDIQTLINLSNSAAQNMGMALFQDSTANAIAAMLTCTPANTGGSATTPSALRHRMLAGTSSSTTMKVRAGATGAGTTTFNGFGAARKLGGVLASHLQIAEIMA